MNILIGILTILLVLLSIFMVFVILMQRGSASGGLGAAMGGGMAESAFGAETSDVLSKTTRNAAIVFFVGAFGLYLAVLWAHSRAKEAEENALPEFEQPAAAQTDAFPSFPSESLEAATIEATEALDKAVESTATEAQQSATEAEKKVEESSSQ